MKQPVISILVCMVVFIGAGYSVSAQQISLELSPPNHEVVAKPGATVPFTFTIQNYGDPTLVQYYVKALSIDPGTDEIKIHAVETVPATFRTTSDEHEFEKPVLLTQNAVLEISIEATIDTKAKETDYRATLVVETLSPQLPEGQVSVGIHGTISSSILFQITKDGIDQKDFRISLLDVRPQFEVELFRSHWNIYDTKRPIPVVLRVQNSAHHAVDVHGSVSIEGTFGSQQSFELAQKRIAANTEDVVQDTETTEAYCNESPDSENCTNENSLVLTNLPIGMHTLAATVYDQQKTLLISKNVSFVVLPILGMTIALGVLISALIILVIVYLQRQRIEAYVHKKRREKRRTSLRP